MSQSPLPGRDVFNAARAVLLKELSSGGECPASAEACAAPEPSPDAAVDEAGFAEEVISGGAVVTQSEVWLGAAPVPPPAPGKSDYRSASVSELWGRPHSVPKTFPEALATHASSGRRLEIERGLNERAQELEQVWKRTRGDFRSAQLRAFARARAESPELGLCAFERQCRSMERVARMRARIDEKRAKLEQAMRSGTVEPLAARARLGFYDHLLGRIERIDLAQSDRAEGKLQEEGEWLAFLAEAEPALDPGCPPQRRLSNMLQRWFGVVSGYLVELEQQAQESRADKEEEREEEEARQALLNAKAARVRQDRKRRVAAVKHVEAPPQEEPEPPLNPYAIPGFRFIRG